MAAACEARLPQDLRTLSRCNWSALGQAGAVADLHRLLPPSLATLAWLAAHRLVVRGTAHPDRVLSMPTSESTVPVRILSYFGKGKLTALGVSRRSANAPASAHMSSSEVRVAGPAAAISTCPNDVGQWITQRVIEFCVLTACIA
jgi:hypothetical protein